MSSVEETSRLAASALAGFGIWQLVSTYQGMAPKLSTLRQSQPDSVAAQDLKDASITSGAVALLAGVLASYAAKSALPLMIIVAVWAIMCITHYRVLMGAPNG